MTDTKDTKRLVTKTSDTKMSDTKMSDTKMSVAQIPKEDTDLILPPITMNTTAKNSVIIKIDIPDLFKPVLVIKTEAVYKVPTKWLETNKLNAISWVPKTNTSVIVVRGLDTYIKVHKIRSNKYEYKSQPFDGKQSNRAESHALLARDIEAGYDILMFKHRTNLSHHESW